MWSPPQTAGIPMPVGNLLAYRDAALCQAQSALHLRWAANGGYSQMRDMRSAISKLRPSRALVLGILCIALVMFSGMIQAAHFHPAGQPDHDCALCLAVHSVAQAASPIVVNLSIRPVVAMVPRRASSRPQRAIHFRLASRPPPVLASFAA